MRLAILAATAAAVLAPAAAHAADAATTNDIRCIVVAGAMASSGAKEAEAAGMMTMIYYLGKLDGRTPNLNLEDSVVDQFMDLSPDQIRADAKRCGDELKTRGAALSIIGRHIQERAKTLQPNPAIKN